MNTSETITSETITSDTLTDAMITALRTEAGSAGDLEQVTVCDKALADDHEAMDTCAEVISEARKQDDETPYVEVVADHGTLYDYSSGEEIRAASAQELSDSKAAGYEGVILVDGRSVYAQE